MGIREDVQTLIAAADDLSKGLQDAISIEQWEGQNGFGEDTFSAPITEVGGLPLMAVVDMTQKARYVEDGKLVNTLATITLLMPVPENGSLAEPRRTEPLDPRDKITLPNGRTAPIQVIQPYLATSQLGWTIVIGWVVR